MARRRRSLFDSIWVRFARSKYPPYRPGFVVTLHQMLKEVNEIKRLLSLPDLSLLRLTVSRLVGNTLQCNVQHWLSPPDPSTNHNFVRKVRHNGTAVWFFESDVFTEWKARGSLLWIHGKRMLFEPPSRLPFANNLLFLKRERGKVHFCTL